MAFRVSHTFTIGPSSNTTIQLNGPEAHIITMESARLAGRTTAGNGPVEEIAVSSDFVLNGLQLSLGTVALNKLAQGGATAGQVLKWNGTAWAPATDEAGGGSSTFLGLTDTPASFAANNFPRVNGAGSALIWRTPSEVLNDIGAAAASHAHAIADVTGLQSALDGKAAVSHTHTEADITGTIAPSRLAQGGATTGQVLKWNGTAWAPGTDQTGGGGANEWSALTGIPPAIDAIDGLVPAADRVPYYTGTNAAALAVLTSFARSLLDDADAATARSTLAAAAAPTAAPIATMRPTLVAYGDRIYYDLGAWARIPTSFSIEVYRGGNLVASGNAVGSLPANEADIGQIFTSIVVATNTVGPSEPAPSLPFRFAGTPPVVQSPPTLTGLPGVGNVLTIAAGSALGVPSPTASWVVQRSPRGLNTWTTITGTEQAASYQQVAADAGHDLSVRVVWNNTVAPDATARSAIVEVPSDTPETLAEFVFEGTGV